MIAAIYGVVPIIELTATGRLGGCAPLVVKVMNMPLPASGCVMSLVSFRAYGPWTGPGLRSGFSEKPVMWTPLPVGRVTVAPIVDRTVAFG